MSVSIVIPCTNAHFYFLHRVLNALAHGTRIPEEVVISLSQSSLVGEKQKEELLSEHSSSFNRLILLQSATPAHSGVNRQRGTDQCTGDIIIYQDADDIPHAQRVDTILNIFDKFDIVHLNHSYVTKESKINFTDPVDIEKCNYVTSEKIYSSYFPTGVYEECVKYTQAYGGGVGLSDTPIHAGAVAVKKTIFDKVKWKSPEELKLHSNYRFEDYEFNMDVLYAFNRSMIIDAPIYWYNN